MLKIPSQTVDVSLVGLTPGVVDPWHWLGAPNQGGPTCPVEVGEDGQSTPAPEPSSALDQVFRGGFRHVKVLQMEQICSVVTYFCINDIPFILGCWYFSALPPNHMYAILQASMDLNF